MRGRSSRGPVRAVLQYGVTLWVALSLNFALPRLAPGDPLEFLIGPELNTLTEAQRGAVTRELGLDRPLIVQYGRYFTSAARGDLGRSIRYGLPVSDVLLDRLRWTLLLLVPALVLSALLGITLGTLAAWRRGRPADAALLMGALAVDGLPAFWIGMVLIAIFVGTLGWLPSFGAVPPDAAPGTLAYAAGIAQRLILPLTTLTLAGFGGTFLLTRAAMLTTLGEDYVPFAEARGVRERGIVFRHALRNALLPVYTSVALSVGALVSGAVVVETVFGWPGLGRVIFDAVAARDYPLLQGAFVFVVLGTVLANLAADLTYPLVDPRVRSPGAEA